MKKEQIFNVLERSSMTGTTAIKRESVSSAHIDKSICNKSNED